MNKYDRYRQKQNEKGHCPHCGKPCAPYYECKERREKKNFRRLLNHMEKVGIIIKKQVNPWEKALYQSNSIVPILPERTRHGYMNHEGDRRLWPRIGKKYFSNEDIQKMAVSVLKEEGHPLHEDVITDRIFQKITEIKEEIIHGKILVEKS